MEVVAKLKKKSHEKVTLDFFCFNSSQPFQPNLYALKAMQWPLEKTKCCTVNFFSSIYLLLKPTDGKNVSKAVKITKLIMTAVLYLLFDSMLYKISLERKAIIGQESLPLLIVSLNMHSLHDNWNGKTSTDRVCVRVCLASELRS